MGYVQERLAEVAQESLTRAIEREHAARRMRVIDRYVKAQRLNEPKVGFVYFIKSGSQVKIGFTKDPAQRLAKLRNGNPHELTLLGSVPGTDDTESFFHQMFAHYRTGGEWFSLEGDLDRFIFTLPDAPKPRKRGLPKPDPSVGIRL